MVSHSRAPLRTHQFRPLNKPHPVEVTCDEAGTPERIVVQGRSRRIIHVKERWRLDDEWWREPLSRLYYLVECADGTLETLYRDLVTNTWYRQRDNHVR